MVIFDFDGVIINSHNLQRGALKHSYNMFFDDDNIPYEEFFLNSGRRLNDIFRDMGFPEQMVEEYQQFSIDNIDRIKIHDGVVNVIKKLYESNTKCALCTGKDRKRTLQILRLFELEKYFCCVICSDDVENSKPHPESIYKIAEKFNDSEYCIVGDGINDLLCGKNAEMDVITIAVTWGDTSYEVLKTVHSDYFVNTVDELEKVMISLGYIRQT